MLKIRLGMVPRGEADTYAVVVFMAVASTTITPLLLKIAFRPGESIAPMGVLVIEPDQQAVG